MKKIISVLFALCVCLSISAQEHMKFMGIPLNGTIDNFALKLKAKGVTYDAMKSRAMSPGCKLYNGTFMGVSVEMSYSSVELAFTPFKNIGEQLMKKYPKAVYEENKDSKGDVNGLSFSILDEAETKRIGIIILTVTPSKSLLKNDCTINLTYADVANFQKSEAKNNEDL